MVDLLRDPFVVRQTGDRVTAKGASYIYTSEVNEPWMSHAIVSDQTGWVLVCVHASPYAISPAAVRDIFGDSQFLESPGKQEGRTKIGIGTRIAPNPLPHHPACGSAPGGSFP